MREATWLIVDAVINLVLGALLVVFPRSLVNLLGVPSPQSAFYPSLLGAVLLGIGLALIIERFRPKLGIRGLGLVGAICINVSAGLLLAGWLLSGRLALPPRGHVVLWLIVALLLGLSVLESLTARSARRARVQT